MLLVPINRFNWIIRYHSLSATDCSQSRASWANGDQEVVGADRVVMDSASFCRTKAVGKTRRLFAFLASVDYFFFLSLFFRLIAHFHSIYLGENNNN